jgi:hypothetical protein
MADSSLVAATSLHWAHVAAIALHTCPKDRNPDISLFAVREEGV